MIEGTAEWLEHKRRYALLLADACSNPENRARWLAMADEWAALLAIRCLVDRSQPSSSTRTH
jgi:hypothetical protein